MSELTVAENTRVEIELIGKGKTREKLAFVLVPDDSADFDKGLLGMGTPLAKAILGHEAKETLEYKRGDILQVKIVSVAENAQVLDPDAGEQREETLRRARDKAQHANMVSFALTFDSKWGDYDPENIQENWEVPKDV
jgi:Transcription elongation factor, GreA/GreB, C-term